MGGHDAELILIAGALLAAGIVGALLADRVRIPGLLLFLGLGMLAGSEGIGGIEFDDAELARTLGTIALVLILFEGGLTAGWSEIRPVLGTAASLATVGTAGDRGDRRASRRSWIFDLSTLEGMIVGAAIAATDSAAIFAVLRRSTLEKRLARSLEGESGMNDPVALLLVIGFIDWIQEPGYGARRHGRPARRSSWRSGSAIGLALGLARASRASTGVRLPTDGIYPVATIAIAGLAYGLAEVAHGSGLLAVYLTALALGTAPASRRGARSSPSTRASAGSPRSPSSSCSACSSSPATLGDVALEGPGALGGADPRRPPGRRVRSRPLLSAASTCASG